MTPAPPSLCSPTQYSLAKKSLSVGAKLNWGPTQNHIITNHNKALSCAPLPEAQLHPWAAAFHSKRCSTPPSFLDSFPPSLSLTSPCPPPLPLVPVVVLTIPASTKRGRTSLFLFINVNDCPTFNSAHPKWYHGAICVNLWGNKGRRRTHRDPLQREREVTAGQVSQE